MMQIEAMGYVGVAALMAIESACIPLPSEIIMPFSGYLVSTGKLNLHGVSLAGAFGCAVGSAVAYLAGMLGGRPFVEKYGRYVLIRARDIDKADRWFTRHGEATVFISRLLPVIRTFISFPAGVARMNFLRFIVYSFVGSVPWCYFLAYVGKVLGDNWQSIRTYFHGADVIIGIVLLVGFALWLYHHLQPDKESEVG
ncbi:MAG: DedA family protein [Armatimonadetes bacterium]|nr:DedA family protein [Armatimonadota bacterium]